MARDNPEVTILFFPTPADFRKWLQKHHDKSTEQWVGFYKRDSGRLSITWPQSVDEALCFGWIDGVRKSIDAESYKIRFSPRRQGSVWSSVNTRKMNALIEKGLVTPAGLKAFENKKEYRSGVYSYEQKLNQLPAVYENVLRRDKKAWEYFRSRPPSYRRVAVWYVVGAKKEETREKRLRDVIEASKLGQTLEEFFAIKKRG